MRTRRFASALSGPRRALLGCAATVAVLFATQQSHAVRPPHAALHWWLADFSVSPPPPASPPIIQQFWLLYTTYLSSKANASMPFSQWLIANGVNDPHAFAAMMWLYQWYARSHEVV